jgi:hypothetical protein
MNHAEIYKDLKHIFINKSTWKFSVVYEKEELQSADDYIFILSFHSEELHDPDDYKDKQGVSGVLLPNGEFCYIPDKNHSRFARALIDYYPKELHNNMVFLSNGSYSHLGVIKGLTKPQIEWFVKYKRKLNDEQLISLNELAYKSKYNLFPNLNDMSEVLSYDFIRYGFANKEEL